MDKLVLYHGSSQILENPFYGGGAIDNDYGLGFYCTKEKEMAKEWAATDINVTGFCNTYEINTKELKILTLDEDDILSWIALLVANRSMRLSSVADKRAREWLVSKHMPDISNSDIVIGYRADDSYFRYVRGFLNGQIGINTLSRAAKLGQLGMQYVLKTEKAFEKLKFVEAEPVDKIIYYSKRIERSEKAREEYESLLLENSDSYKDKISYLMETEDE